MRLVTDGNGSHASQTDLRHLKAVARVLTGRAPLIAEVAEREGIDAGYVRGLMRLAFLAPKVVE
jgi:hypothetical protein